MKARTRVVLAMALAATGFLVHNIADLPGPRLTLLTPETAFPVLVSVLLTTAWVLWPTRLTTWPLLCWVVLHLIGGAVLSVLPLPIWPFDPPQTLYHYAFHACYGATQMPAIIILRRHLRRSPNSTDNT